jgi:hypothetical protein
MAFKSARQALYEASVIGGAWAAMSPLLAMALYPLGFQGGTAEPERMWGVAWGTKTLAVAGVIGVMMALAMIDADRARCDNTRVGIVQVSGLTLGVVAWLLGGLFNLLVWILQFVYKDQCGGSGGASSFACLNRSGLVLNALGVVASLSATLVLLVLFMRGRHSRVAAWLSPILVIGFYVLALSLWEPHVGLGVPSRETE